MLKTADKRQLVVWFEKKKIGMLESVNGVWSFIYEQSWIEDASGFSLSPSIDYKTQTNHTDNSTDRHVQWFFDNLLPEENARSLIAKAGRIDKEDAFSLLELYGSESAGALTMLRPGETWVDGSVEPLPFASLSSRIKNLGIVPLVQGAKKKMSLAGAQHKLPVIYDRGELFEPVGSMPSSHILKPQHEHPNVYWSTVCNEWFVMTLAGKLGLLVPNVAIEHIPEPIYLVERFDRNGVYPHQTRRHIIDACQANGLYAGAKYRLSNVENLSQLVNKAGMKAKTRIRLLRWAIYNALIGNGDAHLKNLSFYVDNDTYSLTPHYDLLSTIVYDGKDALKSPLSQPIGSAVTFADLTQADMLHFGGVLGLPDKLVKKEVAILLQSVVTEFDDLYSIVESWPATANKAGDLKMLREIKYIVMLPMMEKLAG